MTTYSRHKDATGWGKQIRNLATALDMLGQAMEEGDDLLGPMCGGAALENLARLPQHIREQFTEALSDEAARSARADDDYREHMWGAAA